MDSESERRPQGHLHILRVSNFRVDEQVLNCVLLILLLKVRTSKIASASWTLTTTAVGSRWYTQTKNRV